MASTSISTSTLTADELEQARACISQAEHSVVGATRGLSAAQWNFKPAADRWSIAEILEHVALVYERILGPIREQLAQAPPPPAGGAQLDQLVIGQFPVRLKRFKGPEFVHPTGRCTPEESLARLSQGNRGLLEYLESTPDLRRHAIPSPPLKAVSGGAHELMDGYQWVLAAAAHLERHVKQILEVKSDPGYPA